MVNIHLDLSLIDLLSIFSIWMGHFDPVVSLGIEPTIKLLSGYENVFLLFSGVILSIRLFFSIMSLSLLNDL